MKFRYQLMLLLLVSGIVLTIPADIYRYSMVKKLITRMSLNHLESVSQTKEITIHDLIQKKHEMVKALGDDLVMIFQPKEGMFCRNEECRNLALQNIKRYQQRLSKSITAVYIIDTSAKILVSTRDTNIGNSIYNIDFIREVRRKGVNIGEVRFQDGKLVLSVGYAMRYKGKESGILVVDQNADEIIKLTNDYTGLGSTGETYFVMSRGGETIMINPVRYNRGASLTLKLQGNNKSISANQPFLKKHAGFCTDCVDYRGKEVISSYRYIPELDWGIITEIDKDEMFESVREVEKLFLSVIFLLLLIMLFIAYYFSGYFSKPIERLTEVVNKFKKGDLKERTDIRMTNEIGTLSVSFNQMADTIERSMDNLYQSNKALNKFGYIISHDLKAPVQSVSALVDLMMDEYNGKLDPDASKMLGMIKEKCNQMEEMINVILNAAKTGKNEDMLRENVSSESIVKLAIQNIRVPGHITIELADNLPIILYNKISLLQIFQNLISNAVKYNDKEKGKIFIGWEEYQASICFYVKDNGRGIKEQDFNKIFNIFAASDSNPGIDSSGIGLSTVKKIVTENNGEVWVKSEFGKECIFYFTVPKK